MVKLIEDWVQQTRKYPPLEIFAGTTGKQKAEKRISDICEDVYRFNFKEGEVNHVAEMRADFRELEVLAHFGLPLINPDYTYAAIKKFEKSALKAIKALDKMHKKDKLLADYYADWAINPEELETRISRWLLRNLFTESGK